MSGEISLNVRQARLGWTARQSLTTSSREKPLPLAALAASLGWIAVTSSVAPYLALLARGAIMRRAELDEAVFTRGELTVAPGPRGLSWLVPAGDAPLARAFAMADHTSRESRVSSTCALTSRDLLGARDALRRALEQPRTPAALMAALPSDVTRSLGATAKRSGVATLAGLALRALWVQGEVTRTHVEGRLDRERFQYSITQLPKVVPSGAEAVELVAARWFAAHAPASAKAFAEAFSLATGRAVAALKPLHLVDVRVDGITDALLAPSDFTAPEETSAPPIAALLPSGDPYLEARQSLTGLLDAERAAGIDAKKLGAGPVAVFDGEVVGAWSLDRGQVSLSPFADLSSTAREALETERAAVSAFIASELTPPADGRKGRDAQLIAGEFSAEQ